MRWLGGVGRGLRLAGRAVRPGAFMLAARLPMEPPDLQAYEDVRAEWEARLGSARPAATTVVYQFWFSASESLEAKAVGLLQAVALVAAGTIVTATSDVAAVTLLAVGALLYLASAATGCCVVLVPRMRLALDIEEIFSETEGHAEMLASASLNRPHLARVAMVLRAAARDLARGGVLTVAALLAGLG